MTPAKNWAEKSAPGVAVTLRTANGNNDDDGRRLLTPFDSLDQMALTHTHTDRQCTDAAAAVLAVSSIGGKL